MKTDEELFQVFRARGDRAALIELRRRHIPLMMKTLRRQFSDVETMKRIVRRAFHRLESQKIGSGEGDFTYAAYIALCGSAIVERRIVTRVAA